MKIEAIEARWLRAPIPEAGQHTSDFGRLRTFDAVLVTVRTSDGAEGFGEAKAAVGSSGDCASLVTLVERELGPQLIGRDPRRITEAWERMYCGARGELALSRGRSFPDVARRGPRVAAIGAIDTALWDLSGQAHGVPVMDLLGGACHDQLPAYASGGWADAGAIGAELGSFVARGFGAVKMRVGAMDRSVEVSAARVLAAREALGPEIELMVDAHGTFSLPEAKRFVRLVESANLRWFEEPTVLDDVRAAAELRAVTDIPIAMGESLSTRFEFAEVLQHRAADVLQPDVALVGGVTEARRVAMLAETAQVELAPHLWGSAVSYLAGLHVAFASPAARILEVSLGANPLLRELPESPPTVDAGLVAAPTAPGLGFRPRADLIEAWTVPV
ncbi:MAG: L-alanine-DL-glutamate epimerase-like enolase superfamily enzyme [Planctomycetota bacterium]|jgi:L-alanine-DL-glutamate epimerase-like enolase superfamily enzyme